MKKLVLACLLMLAGSAFGKKGGANGAYQEVGTETKTVGNDLRRTVTTVQVGKIPLNRFRMYRITKQGLPANQVRAVLLLVPPLGEGFPFYESSGDMDYNHSWAGELAGRGYDVWGYSTRAEGLDAGSCESGRIDCSAMNTWGLQSVIDDIMYVRRRLGAAAGSKPVVIGGESLGSFAAIATLNANPKDFTGAILLDAAPYDTNEEVRRVNREFCSQLDAKLASGTYYDGTTLPGFRVLVDLANNAPKAPSQIPGLPPGLTNHQALVALLGAPNTTPTQPRPNYFLVAGNAAEDRFLFSDDALVRNTLGRFDSYFALRTVRDSNCSLAGDRTFSDKLDRFRGVVYMAAAGHGFGTAMNDTAKLMTSARVKLDFKEDFGHIDHYFSALPTVIKWLEENLSR